MATDFRSLDRNDQVILVAGVLAFIASFLPYYGVTVHGGVASFGGASSSTSAWHSWNTFELLILVATAIAAIQVFASSSLPESPVSYNAAVAGLSALGAVLIIIRSFTLDSGTIGPLDYGLRWGAYVLMVLAVVQAVFAVLRLRASGEPMPWAQRHGTDSTAPPAA